MDRDQLDRAIDHVTRLIGEESVPSNLGSLTYTLGSLMKLDQGTDKEPEETPPDTWISVEERLPDGCESVLVLAAGVCTEAYRWSAVDWRSALFGTPLVKVTHWRPLLPLPEPPGEG